MVIIYSEISTVSVVSDLLEFGITEMLIEEKISSKSSI